MYSQFMMHGQKNIKLSFVCYHTSKMSLGSETKVRGFTVESLRRNYMQPYAVHEHQTLHSYGRM